MATNRSDGLFSKEQLLSLYLPSILLSLGTSMVAPVIPTFARSFHVSFGEASMVFVLAQVGALVATFPAGYLMDTVGRRPVLLAGPLLTAVSSFMTPFSGSFNELLFWRFLGGAATQLWMQARLVVIADTARHEHRARQVTWMNGTARGGQLFGPSIGGFLAEGFGVHVPFIIHAAITLLATLPSVALIKESAPGRRSGDGPAAAAEQDIGWRGIIGMMLTFQMLVFLLVQFSANLSRGGNDFGALNLYAVYAYNVSPTTLGLMNTVSSVVGLPVPFVTGYLMDKFGRRSVIVPGFAFYGGSVLVMAFTAYGEFPFLIFAAAYVAVQFTIGSVGGTMQVLGTDMAPAVARGRFFAIWRLIAQLGSTVTPGIFALLSERINYGAGFVYLSLSAFVVATLVGAVLGDTRGGSRRAGTSGRA